MLKHDFCHEFKKVNVYQIKNRKSSIIFDDDDGDDDDDDEWSKLMSLFFRHLHKNIFLR